MPKKAQFAAAATVAISGAATTVVEESRIPGTLSQGITWTPDASLRPYFDQMAQSQGITASQAMNDVMNWGLANGWSVAVPQLETLFLSRAAAQRLRELLDLEHLNGDLMCEKVAQLAAHTA